MDKVTCRLCGDSFLWLNSHINNLHHVSVAEYHRLFPDAPTASGAFRQNQGRATSIGMAKVSVKSSLAQKRRFANPEERERTAEKTRRWWATRTEEQKWEHLNKSFCSEATREKFREMHRAMTQEERDAWIDRSFCSEQSRRKCQMRPTNPEKLLDALLQKYFPNMFKYNGDFSQGVTLKRLIPDFININGKKQVIEVFGDYFHSNKVMGEPQNWKRTELGRIMAFNALGYECLVLWEKDITTKSDEELVGVINQFLYARRHYSLGKRMFQPRGFR